MGDRKSFGERLAEARAQCDMTRMALADTIDVARSTITKWEADSSQPTADHVAKLCQVLRVTPNALLGMDEDDVPITAHDRVLRLFEAEGIKKGATILRLRPAAVEALLDGRLQLAPASLQKIADAYKVPLNWLKAGDPDGWAPTLANSLSARLRFLRISLGKRITDDYWRWVEESEEFATEEREAGRLRSLWSTQMVTSQQDDERMAALKPYTLEWLLSGKLSTQDADQKEL